MEKESNLRSLLLILLQNSVIFVNEWLFAIAKVKAGLPIENNFKRPLTMIIMNPSKHVYMMNMSTAANSEESRDKIPGLPVVLEARKPEQSTMYF